MPLLPHFLAYLGGLLAALKETRGYLLPGFLPGLCLLAGLVFLVRLRRRRLFAWLTFAALLGLGLSAPHWKSLVRPANHILNHLQEGRPAEVTGVLEEPPAVFRNKIRFRVRLESIQYDNAPLSVQGVARVTLYQPEHPLQVGDRARFHKLRLKRPRNFKNPGRFDYEHFIRSRGIEVLGNLSRAGSIKILGPGEVGPLARFRAVAHQRIAGLLDRNLSREAAGLLKAMLLGEKQALPENLRQAYIDTGLAHLMAVSGLHIGFVAAFTYLLTYPLVFRILWRWGPRWAMLGRARKLTALFCLFPVLFYMVLVGPQISALRAGMMVVVFLCALLLDREKHLLNALMLAAFIILIWNPEAVRGPSFLLSFSALLAILIAVRLAYNARGDSLDQLGEVRWHRRLFMPIPFRENPRQWWVNLFAGSALVALAALLGTLPVLIVFFNHLSTASLFLNILLVPLASVLIPFSLLVSFISLGFPWVGDWLIPVSGWLSQVFVVVPTVVAALPYTSFYLPTPPPWWTVCYYLLIMGLPVWWMTKDRLLQMSGRRAARMAIPGLLIVAGLGTALGLAVPRFPGNTEHPLSIYLLDVGQGESIFLELPNHETLLLDSGGYYKNSLDVGRLVVAPFLWNRGLRRVDYAGVTHSDQDHIAGLESLAGLMPIGHFLQGDPSLQDDRIDSLRDRLTQEGTRILRLPPGRRLEIGGVHIQSLHPLQSYLASRPEPKRIDNHYSWVLRVDYQEFTLLLTGDITEEEERFLLESGVNLRADVLKAPHHGSRFSSSPDFIRSVAPRDVLISSGHLNSFRHPHPEVTARYRAIGTRVWRTDRQGALRIDTNGKSYRIRGHPDL